MSLVLCSWTVAKMSTMASAGLRGFYFNAECSWSTVPSVLSTSNDKALISLVPLIATKGTMGSQVPFL